MNLSFINDELKEVKTHKREFLEQIERIMPWGELEELVRPCYYEGKRGNKPYDLELMLRIHLLQNLYNLSDEGTRNEVIDSRAFSDFCGVESSNQIPDGDTIGSSAALCLGLRAMGKTAWLLRNPQFTPRFAAVLEVSALEIAPRFWKYGETIRPNSAHAEMYSRRYALYKQLRAFYKEI